MANVDSLTKYFITAQEGFTTTLNGSISSGAGTVVLNSTAGYSDGDQVALTIEPGSPTAKQVFTGTVSGTSIINVEWTEGNNQSHASGVTVADYVSATHQAAMVEGVKTSLNDNGTLKSAAVTSSITNGSITDTMIAGLSANKLTNPYKFSVYRNGAFNVNGKIFFDTEVFDTANNYDPTTGRLTITVPGFYYLTAGAGSIINSGTASAIYFDKNGTEWKTGVTFIQGTTGNALAISTVSAFMNLAINDYIEVRGLGGSAGQTGRTTFFEGFMVSAT